MNKGMDVWVIQNNPQAIFKALEGMDSDNETILYGNCASRFYIDKHKIDDINFSACIYSPKADRLILITKQSGITLGQLERLLLSKDITFHQITFRDSYKQKQANGSCKEMWVARDSEVLKEALEESSKNSDFRPAYFPNLSSIIMVGYYNEEGKFINMTCLRTKGVLEFDDKFICLSNDGSKHNVTPQSVTNSLREVGMTPNIRNQGYPSVVKPAKTKVRALTKSR